MVFHIFEWRIQSKFKLKFELSKQKEMLQLECNSKLLYFLNLINKNN
jgi:hypothetical protein